MFLFTYGAVSYVLFLGTFLYLIGFVGNYLVPKSIDSGAEGPVGQAVIINVVLIALLGLQHSIMARPRFKTWWTKFIPKPIERSTFVLFTNLLLLLLVWQWRPMTAIVWQVDHSIGRSLLTGLSFGGWALVLYSTFLIDHFDLFGMRQVFLHLRGRPYAQVPFVTPLLYKIVRNPLMLGFVTAFWFTPTMTQGHLLFAIVTTAYILVGISLEERDAAEELGDGYRRYRANTPMLLPWPRKKSGPAEVSE